MLRRLPLAVPYAWWAASSRASTSLPAKKINKDVKDTKIKVKVTIEADKLRVSSASKDALQQVIGFLRDQDYLVSPFSSPIIDGISIAKGSLLYITLGSKTKSIPTA